MYNKSKTVIAILVFLSLSLINLQGQNFEKAGVPVWVEAYNPPLDTDVSKYEVESGYFTSLSDVQYHHDTKTYYVHGRTNILSNAGVESASQIQVPYDSTYQSVQFHSLVIHRDGKAEDRTSEVEFNIINNEDQLQSNIYSGSTIAHAVLSDVRNGDIIEYSYSTIGTNPIYNGHTCTNIFLNSYEPIDHLLVKYTFPKSYEYSYKIKNENDVNITESSDEEYHSIKVVNTKAPAVDLEESMSVTLNPFNYFELTSFKDWKSVNSWAHDVFYGTPIDSVDVLVDVILDGSETLDEKIYKLVDYVQNEIRYMGIESGIGSHKPSAPKLVMEQRFGDCKDKSLLLSELLRHIGIADAYPVLIGATFGKMIKNYLPSYGPFDHCIVKFLHQGEEYWIDPTISLQGGPIQERKSFDYGYALVIDNKSGSLEKMNVDDQYSNFDIVEEFDVSDFNKEGKLNIITTYTGKNADNIRRTFEYYSFKDISQSFRDIYARLYPDINTVGKLIVKDDYENNIFTTEEKYTIGQVWKENTEDQLTKTKFSYEPLNIYQHLDAGTCEDKKYPIDFTQYTRLSQTTTILIPEVIEIDKSTKRTENVTYTFEKKHNLEKGKKLILEYNYKINSELLQPEDFNKVCKDMHADFGDLPLEVFYTGFSRLKK